MLQTRFINNVLPFRDLVLRFGFLKSEHILYSLHIGAVNDGGIRQVSFPLLRLLRQNVTFVSVLSLELSRAGERKTFLRTGLAFHFWHCL